VLFETTLDNVFKPRTQLLVTFPTSAIGRGFQDVSKLAQLDKFTKVALALVLNKEPATMLPMVFQILLAVATKPQ